MADERDPRRLDASSRPGGGRPPGQHPVGRRPGGPGARGDQSVSGLAVAGFVLSMTLCCPLTSLVGAVLGVVALRRISRSRGALGGRGLAIAAIILGSAALVVQVVLLEHMARSQVSRLERRALERVEVFIGAVERGDHATALEQWVDATVRPTVTDLDELRVELDRRFGALRSTTIVSRSTEGSVLSPRLEVALVFSFDRAELAGAARLTLRTGVGGPGGLPGFGGEDARLLELRIDDVAGGAIVLPRSAASGAGGSP